MGAPGGGTAPVGVATVAVDAAPGEVVETETFGDRLAGLVAERNSQIVLGLDPDPTRLWPRALELAGGTGDEPAVRAARAVRAHCALVLDAPARSAWP